MYHDGRGVPQNFARARYYVATERGETKAAVNLGVMDASGERRPRDYRKAIKWFLLAAQRGDDRAKNNIGAMYFNGQGVPRDLVRSLQFGSRTWLSGCNSKQSICCSPHDSQTNGEGAGDGKQQANVHSIIPYLG
jgi:TPR repeat protein